MPQTILARVQTPPKSWKCLFELGKFFSKKVPQTIRARVETPPPPLTGNAQIEVTLNEKVLPLPSQFLFSQLDLLSFCQISFLRKLIVDFLGGPTITH